MTSFKISFKIPSTKVFKHPKTALIPVSTSELSKLLRIFAISFSISPKLQAIFSSAASIAVLSALVIPLIGCKINFNNLSIAFFIYFVIIALIHSKELRKIPEIEAIYF